MRISQVKFRKNAADPKDRYKTEHAEVTVELTEDESEDDAFAFARETVERALGIDVSEDDVARAERTLAAARKAGLR